MNRPRLIIASLLLLMITVGLLACGNYELEIQNKTDEVVDIYIDQFYEGAIAPNNYLIIRRLSKGEHYVEAYDLDENLIVDDTIYVDNNSKWIIYETYSRFY